MKSVLCYAMCMYFFLENSMSDEIIANTKLSEYLKTKSETVQEAFSKKSNSVAAGVKIQNIATGSHFPDSYGNVFSLFNETFILLNDGLYKMFAKNGTINVEKFKKSSINGKFIFTKVMEFEDTGVILIKTETDINIYKLQNNKISFMHSILAPNASDAHLFKNNNSLYLIIINNKGDNLAISTLYKWVGTYFDEEESIFTTGATKVTSFTADSTEIIIILQTFPRSNFLSTVYQFSFGRLKKIRDIATDDPVHVDVYKTKFETYVIIYEKSKNNSVYKWNGSQLVITFRFQTHNVINKSVTMATNMTSIIVVPQQEKIQIFRMLSKEMKLAGEKTYLTNFSSILSIYSPKNNNVIYITGLDQSGVLYITKLSIIANFSSIENHTRDQHSLRNCFNNIEMNIYTQRKMLKVANNVLSQVKIQKTNELSKSKRSTSNSTEEDLQNNLNDLKTRLQKLQLAVNSYEDTKNTLIINNKTTINGFITADKLTGKNLKLKLVNDQNWTPQNWLNYKQQQNLNSPVTANQIVINELNTAPSDTVFTEFLVKNGDQNIWGALETVNLTANKIFAEKINDVQLKDIYIKSEAPTVLGLKTFNNLNTREAKIKQLNELPVEQVLSKFNTDASTEKTRFDDNLEVENLVVDTIDNIQWNNFKDSVFRIGVTKEINGDLTFPELHTNNITLKTIKKVKIDDLLTTSTDQSIDADIEFVSIFAENITANTTNGIKLAESAIQIEDDTTVEGPVKFDKLFVRGNLELKGKLDDEFFSKNGEHVMGTNESDLWQRYNGVVRIKGDLYLKNVTVDQNATCVVANEEVSLDIPSIYWTKNTAQSIPTYFEAQKGLSLPHLVTNKLNNISFSQYMINSDENRLETSYHFQNVAVVGEVFLNPGATHSPDFTKLNDEAVKTTGSYNINGKKTYLDTLRAEHLDTPLLNGIHLNEMLSSESSMNITGKKKFKNIVVKGTLSCDLQSVELINGINVKDLLENTIYTDEPRNIEQLDFTNVTVTDLWATNLNGRKVNQHIMNIQKILASDKIDTLVIHGKVSLRNVTDLSKINWISFEKLLNNTWKNGKGGGILVNLEFLEHVKVKNLITGFINDVNLKQFTKKCLYRNKEQNITAVYTFNSIEAENIVVSKITNISTANFIDVSSEAPQNIHALGGLELGPTTLRKSLKTDKTSPCNLIASLKKFRDPPTHNWRNIEVKGNATFLDPESTFYRVFEKAVTINSKNIIEAPVEFSKHIMAENVISNGHINDVDLQHIIDDAILMKSNKEQVVTGRKVFTSMNIDEAIVTKNTDIPVVNNIDIPELNKVIVKRSDTHNYKIKGKKTFVSGLQCDRVYGNKVLNTDMDNIVNIENSKKIPLATFESIEVINNFNISTVNHFDFNGFLKKRLLNKGVNEQSVSGIYYFDNLQVEYMATPSINEIEMDNVVFDVDQQNITASKRFKKPVDIFGNITSKYINGVNFSEMYQASVTKNETINGSVEIVKASFVNGNIITKYINGYPVEQIKQILNQGTTRSKTEKIQDIQSDIIDKIKSCLDHIKFLANDYMYIEKTQALQISVPNTVSAKIMESKGYVLIHVNGEESGKYCGLPENCICPVQYSIEVSPEHSVAIFPNKGSQRIFTYNEDGIIVHLLTNSFSTDSTCRSENSKVINEVSMLSWNTLPPGNSTGSFYKYDELISGYISGAEFFTLHGQTYAIIGRYYNPITDNHDLDCYLIKFSHDKSKVKEIQKIPTKGAWSIYLFHTAQGVTLVIGNIKTMKSLHAKEETQIYRFNENKDKFDLLRIVPAYGCSMATGVVLGTDSLIVLAHQYAPLQVLKYYPYFDNYYFYQSFEIETPVVGISVFYTGGFGITDAYLCIVTRNENYFIYSFRFIEGWKLESSGELDGLKNLIPFESNEQSYLFAPSSKISLLLTVVKHGSV